MDGPCRIDSAAAGKQVEMVAFINGLSPMHMLFFMVVALLLFGSRLPDVARSIGKAITEFKRGLKDSGSDDMESQEREKLKPGPTNTVERGETQSDKDNPATGSQNQ